MADGRPNMGIDAMPRIGANVDERLAAEFRARARQRGVSVSTVVREFLYEAARERFNMELPDVPSTRYARK